MTIKEKDMSYESKLARSDKEEQGYDLDMHNHEFWELELEIAGAWSVVKQ